MINLGRKQQEIEKKSKPVYVGPERGDPISGSWFVICLLLSAGLVITCILVTLCIIFG
jgi:hypothetical protein